VESFEGSDGGRSYQSAEKLQRLVDEGTLTPLEAERLVEVDLHQVLEAALDGEVWTKQGTPGLSVLD
jgi:hypothetical protein